MNELERRATGEAFRPLTPEERAALELTDLERQAVLDVIRAEPTIGTVAAMRTAGIDRPKRELKVLADTLDEDELREARGWNLRKVEQTMWGIATDPEHQSVFRAGQFLMRAYGDPRFRERVDVEHAGTVEVASNDVAAAIDRFTSQVVRLAERGRAELAAGEPGG